MAGTQFSGAKRISILHAGNIGGDRHAEIKRIAPEPAVPPMPGGRAGTSRLVDLAAHPAVARRQAVDERLLSGLCGHDTRGHGVTYTEADASTLAGIARERVGGEPVMLRRQAFAALAKARTLPALAADGSVLHHEVLARLPLAGADEPLVAGTFVPIAMRLGLAADLDRLIVLLALDQLDRERRPLAVNLSEAALTPSC